MCDVDTNTAAKNSIRVLTREIGQWEPIKVVLPSKKEKKEKKVEEKSEIGQWQPIKVVLPSKKEKKKKK